MNAELMHFNAPDRIAGRHFLPFSFKRHFYLGLSKQSMCFAERFRASH